MKLPIYFEAYGSVGITVLFVSQKAGATVSMMLAECPDAMRQAVNSNANHFKDKTSGYELKNGQYILSTPIKL